MKKLKLNKHLRIIWAIEKGLFICWLIIAIVLYPYSRMGYFSSLAHRNHKVSLFQHRLDMDLLFLLELVLMAMFFGLKSFVAKQKKDDYQEIICRMKKSKKPDTDEIQMLETFREKLREERKGLANCFSMCDGRHSFPPCIYSILFWYLTLRRPMLPMRTSVTLSGWRIAIIARGGKMYSYSEMVNILLKEFPEISEQYAEDIAWLKDTFQNQESKGQTSYFDHCFCDYIGHLLADKQQDNLKIEKIFAFLENMATSRDSNVRDLLQVTVLEYFRSWSLFQSKSEKFMLPETKKMFDYVKSYLQAPSQAVPEYILQ